MDLGCAHCWPWDYDSTWYELGDDSIGLDGTWPNDLLAARSSATPGPKASTANVAQPCTIHGPRGARQGCWIVVLGGEDRLRSCAAGGGGGALLGVARRIVGLDVAPAAFAEMKNVILLST